MSEQDDWARFCEMMEREGWYITPSAIIPGNAHLDNWWLHSSSALTWYEGDSGKLVIDDGAVQHVGTWREWLASGTSPVPF